jgi:hypothetical protein
MTHTRHIKAILVHEMDKFALITNQEYNKNYEDEAYQQANC